MIYQNKTMTFQLWVTIAICLWENENCSLNVCLSFEMLAGVLLTQRGQASVTL